MCNFKYIFTDAHSIQEELDAKRQRAIDLGLYVPATESDESE